MILSNEKQQSDGYDDFSVPPSQYNPLDEPSPLGLRLRKSPSLLDLIQMKLSQSTATSSDLAECESFNSSVRKENKGIVVPGSTDKLKASNFTASHLKIGGWEVKSISLVLIMIGKRSACQVILVFLVVDSINQDMKVIWWQNVILLSISLYGKFLKVD